MSMSLENKDRSWIAACGFAVFVVLLATYWVPTGPRRHYAASQTALSGAKDDLKMSQLLKLEEEQRIESQQAIRDQLRARPEGFNFFTEIDRTVTDANLKARAQLNKTRVSTESGPQELIELRLNSVTMDEVVDLLHRIYDKNDVIAVYQMNYLRPARDGKGLECSITFSTIKPGV